MQSPISPNNGVPPLLLPSFSSPVLYLPGFPDYGFYSSPSDQRGPPFSFADYGSLGPQAAQLLQSEHATSACNSPLQHLASPDQYKSPGVYPPLLHSMIDLIHAVYSSPCHSLKQEKRDRWEGKARDLCILAVCCMLNCGSIVIMPVDLRECIYVATNAYVLSRYMRFGCGHSPCAINREMRHMHSCLPVHISCSTYSDMNICITHTSAPWRSTVSLLACDKWYPNIQHHVREYKMTSHLLEDDCIA